MYIYIYVYHISRYGTRYCVSIVIVVLNSKGVGRGVGRARMAPVCTSPSVHRCVLSQRNLCVAATTPAPPLDVGIPGQPYPAAPGTLPSPATESDMRRVPPAVCCNSNDKSSVRPGVGSPGVSGTPAIVSAIVISGSSRSLFVLRERERERTCARARERWSQPQSPGQ